MSNKLPTPEDLQRDDDVGLEHLLREVGARDEPSQAITDDVRHAVHAEWQTVVAARQRRKRFVNYSMAAGILGFAVSLGIVWRLMAGDPLNATVARIDGTVDVMTAGGERHPLAVGERLAADASLRTNGASRIALDFGNGVVARIDHNSELSFASNRHVALAAGAMYVDAVPNAGGDQSLTVDTSFGAVRHVGTQYQVRILSNGVEVGVREGRVEVTSPLGTNVGSAGEQLHLSDTGNVTRHTLSTIDASWQWAIAISPAFNIDNRSLQEFLTWAARETGHKVSFDTPATEQAASAIKLRGSIEGLDIETALTAVLSTTPLKRVKADDESIHIVAVRD